MWYKKYPKLNSALFTFENSGKRSNDPPPYSLIERGGELIDIKDKYSVSGYKILGYTESPPFPAEGYLAIAVMFENGNFEKTWWHYPRDEPYNNQNAGDAPSSILQPPSLVVPSRGRWRTNKTRP
jgi:hypothetical protein